jgi:hypothetical protein
MLLIHCRLKRTIGHTGPNSLVERVLDSDPLLQKTDLTTLKTASQSEHSDNHSGAHIQNTKLGEGNYVHEEIVCGMSLRNEA